MTTKERKLEAEIVSLKDRLTRIEADRKARQAAFEKGSVAEPVRKLIRRGVGPSGLPDARPKVRSE